MSKISNIAVTNNGQHYNVTVNDYSMSYRTFDRYSFEKELKTAIILCVMSALSNISKTYTIVFETEYACYDKQMFLLSASEYGNNIMVEIFDCYDEVLTGHDYCTESDFEEDVLWQTSDSNGNFVPFSLMLHTSSPQAMIFSRNCYGHVCQMMSAFTYYKTSDLDLCYLKYQNMVNSFRITI